MYKFKSKNIFFCFQCRYKKREANRRYALESVQTDESYISPGQTLRELIDNSQTSGSGSGLPLLVRKVIYLKDAWVGVNEMGAVLCHF